MLHHQSCRPQSSLQAGSTPNFASETDKFHARPKFATSDDTRFPEPLSTFAPLLSKFSRENTHYIARRLQPYPEVHSLAVKELLQGDYYSYSTKEINAIVTPLISMLQIGNSDLYAFSSEEVITEFATEYVRLVQAYCLNHKSLARSDRRMFIDGLKEELSHSGVSLPSPLTNFASETVPEILIASLARLHCDRWWRRQLRKLCFRQGEAFLRSYGKVGAGISPYLSGVSQNRVKSRQDAAESFLSTSEIESDLGEIVPMADVVAASLANPRNRLSELYVRAKGFDEIAEESGLESYMLTFTTPSRFHVRNKTSDKKNSYPNPKFDGSSPADGQRYLCNVWAKIRAKAARNSIRPFGIRVAEAHHDGTPHWHLCVHVSSTEAAKFIDICRDYACEDSNEELTTPRRQEARFQAIKIDPEVGSPRSYLFKYLTKNLVGSNDKSDETDAPQYEEVNTVRNWASLWSIRQFQVFGSPSVTVWRELRRLRDKDLSEISAQEFEDIRDSACTGDWARFVSLMGGVCVRRDNQPVRPEKKLAGENQYGELIYQIRGLVMSQCLDEIDAGTFITKTVITREKSWRIVSPYEVKSRNRALGLRTHEVRPLDNYQ